MYVSQEVHIYLRVHIHVHYIHMCTLQVCALRVDTQSALETELLAKAISCTPDSSEKYIEEIYVTQLNIRAWVCTCVF